MNHSHASRLSLFTPLLLATLSLPGLSQEIILDYQFVKSGFSLPLYVTNAGEGRVAKAFSGYLDFPSDIDPDVGVFVKAYISPAYSSFSRGTVQKHIKMFRPFFIAGTKFQYRVGVSADAGTPFPLTTLIGELPGGTSLWDTATWSTTYVWNGLTNVVKFWHSVDSWPGSYTALYLEIENTGKSAIKLVGIDYLLGDGGVL